SREAVSYLLLIGKLQTLASSYYNGKIILWDTVLGKDTKTYIHKEGIYGMTFDSTKNLLFACGYSHKIYVYDPYIEFAVYNLKGHAGSINGVIANEKDSELISLDICGNIKLWDLNTLSCFQTFN